MCSPFCSSIMGSWGSVLLRTYVYVCISLTHLRLVHVEFGGHGLHLPGLLLEARLVHRQLLRHLGPRLLWKTSRKREIGLRARMVQYSPFLRSRLLLVCVNKCFIYLLVLLIVSSSERCRILNRNKMISHTHGSDFDSFSATKIWSASPPLSSTSA